MQIREVAQDIHSQLGDVDEVNQPLLCPHCSDHPRRSRAGQTVVWTGNWGERRNDGGGGGGRVERRGKENSSFPPFLFSPPSAPSVIVYPPASVSPPPHDPPLRLRGCAVTCLVVFSPTNSSEISQGLFLG